MWQLGSARVCYILTSPQDRRSPPFLPSVGGDPVNRLIIALNMETPYSHQDCSAGLMDNFCRLSRAPSGLLGVGPGAGGGGVKVQMISDPNLWPLLPLRRPFKRSDPAPQTCNNRWCALVTEVHAGRSRDALCKLGFLRIFPPSPW